MKLRVGLAAGGVALLVGVSVISGAAASASANSQGARWCNYGYVAAQFARATDWVKFSETLSGTTKSKSVDVDGYQDAEWSAQWMGFSSSTEDGFLIPENGAYTFCSP